MKKYELSGKLWGGEYLANTATTVGIDYGGDRLMTAVMTWYTYSLELARLLIMRQCLQQ